MEEVSVIFHAGPASAPSKYCLVGASSDDFLLKTSKRLPAFTIQERHIYVENSQQGVRGIFDAGCLSRGGPAHLLSNTVLVEGVFACQELVIDASNAG